MNQQYLSIWDLVLTPIYLGILIFFAKRHRDKNYAAGHPLRKYYLPGLYVKFLGVIFIALIYQYYYNGGDTFNYFIHSKIVNSSLNDSPISWLKLLIHTSPDTDPKLYAYTSQMEFYNDPASYMVIQITAILGIITFNTYIPSALLFAYFSFTGIWAMYRTFTRIYPSMVRPLAVSFLFVPGTFVWGSAIFKDTICMFGLGWMTYATFRIFVNRDFSLKNFFLLAISIYLVAIIKVYILLAFLPALSLWILITFSNRIRIPSVRFIVRTFVIGVVILGFIFTAQIFSSELNKYSLDNLTKTIESTRSWIVYSSGEEGSAYDLGPIDQSFAGMINKFPQAVVVTLFRPFLWESKKPIMFISALESLAFSILVLMVFIKNGLRQTFRLIFKSPNLLFFFIYSLIFAFAVGISTGNFGTLSRYKIPCTPFFAALLLILYYQKTPIAKTISSNGNYQKRPVHNLA